MIHGNGGQRCREVSKGAGSRTHPISTQERMLFRTPAENKLSVTEIIARDPRGLVSLGQDLSQLWSVYP